MTVDYTLHVSKSIVYFCIEKRKKNSHANKIDPKVPFNKRNFNVNNKSRISE